MSFCALFCAVCFRQFLKESCTNLHQLGSYCQCVPTILVELSNGSTNACLRFRQGTDTILEKWCFVSLFSQIGVRITPKNVTTAKMEPMRCPTGRSTEIKPQLAVPVKYEAPSVLYVWKCSASFTLFEVETLEIFAQLWLALGSPKLLEKR